MNSSLIVLLSCFLFTQSAQPRDAPMTQTPPPGKQTKSPELEESAKLNREVIRLIDEEKFSAALPLARRAVEITEHALGKDHELVGSSLINLAEIYLRTAKYDEAEPLYRRCLGILEKKYGRDSKLLADTLDRLALIRFARKDNGESEHLYSRALSIRQKALGPEHIEVARSFTQLGKLYERTERPGKAFLSYKQSLEIIEKAAGSREDVAEALYLCACALIQDNKREAANQYQERERTLSRIKYVGAN